MNYYRRFPADYAKDTRHLNLMQHGAYAILLDLIYSRETPLPKDPAEVARLCACRSKAETASVTGVLQEFFTEMENGWTHKRVEKEIKLYESLICRNKKNGKKGGRPKTQSVSSGFPNKTHSLGTQMAPTLALTPTLTEEREKKEAAPVGAVSFPDPQVVPIHLWLCFVEMRKKIRHPLTDHAGELIRLKLQKFKEAGHDPIEILENSIRNSWRDVFEPKEKSDGTRSTTGAGRNDSAAKGITRNEKRIITANEQAERVFGGTSRLVASLRPDLSRRSDRALSDSVPRDTEPAKARDFAPSLLNRVS